MTKENGIKYLDRMEWLRNRYKEKDGSIVLSIGKNQSTYSKLELLFFRKYNQ